MPIAVVAPIVKMAAPAVPPVSVRALASIVNKPVPVVATFVALNSLVPVKVSFCPELNVLGGCVKVLVRRQQGQIVSATELDE